MDGLITLQHNNRADLTSQPSTSVSSSFGVSTERSHGKPKSNAIVRENRVREWIQDQQHTSDQTKQQVNIKSDLQTQSSESIDLSLMKNTETVNRVIASDPIIDLSQRPETSTNEQSALSLCNPKASRMFFRIL